MPPWIALRTWIWWQFTLAGPEWWNAWFTLFGGIATTCAVVTAFLVQQREFRRDARRDRIAQLEMEVAAMNWCKGAMVIYDSIFTNHEVNGNRSASDAINRMNMMSGVIKKYLDAPIYNFDVVSMLSATDQLMLSAVRDIQAQRFKEDQVSRQFFLDLGVHRQKLSDGARSLIALVEKLPAFPS
jgi:hypothetical protein